MPLNKQIIIIDNGSKSSKNGFAGVDKPNSIIPTVIGYPKYTSIMTDVKSYAKEYYIGEEAMQLRGVLKKISPIQGGVINDWNAIEKIWDYTFSKILNVLPDEHYVLLTEPPLNPRRNKEKMAEIMFETFNVPALYIANQAVLSLFASGRTTGCVVDIGDGDTHIVPIYKGIPITRSIKKTEIAGRELTIYVNYLIRQGGLSINSSAEREIMEDIKKKCCFVAMNAEEEIKLAKKNGIKEKSYVFPDGESVQIGLERFLAPEIIFDPSIINKDFDPLDDLIVQAISENNVTLRRVLLENIVLSGGSSLLPGLKERLTMEIQKQIPEKYNIEVFAPTEQICSAWIGGSKLASHPHDVIWITSEEYKKYGPEIIHQCF